MTDLVMKTIAGILRKLHSVRVDLVKLLVDEAVLTDTELMDIIRQLNGVAIAVKNIGDTGDTN